MQDGQLDLKEVPHIQVDKSQRHDLILP